MTAYINRELSWIEFNKRVLGEAFDLTNPIMAQVNFLSIFSSNLDEFFMVRVGSLWDQTLAGKDLRDTSGLTPAEQITKINEEAQKLVKIQYERYGEIKERLKEKGLTICSYQELSEEEKQVLDTHYDRHIFPLITPNVFETSQAFPLVKNERINVFLLLLKEGVTYYGNVQLPSQTSRLFEVKGEKETKFVLLESVIMEKLETLFHGYKIVDVCKYRVTRNADLRYDEEEAQDLLEKIEKSIKKRNWGQVVRLEVEDASNSKALTVLKKIFKVNKEAVYKVPLALDLTFLSQFFKKKWNRLYGYEEFTPRDVPYHGSELFTWIKEKDRISHMPYDSFDTVLRLIKEAARDEKVMAIKQTLYRVSDKSPIIDALEEAALAGKNVTVLLELKARFDEENNIHWTKRLEKAGALVIHGPADMKTHSKMLLIVREEGADDFTTYCHLATGNYNEKTAKIYEDIGLFTANPEIGEDLISIFNYLSTKTEVRPLHHIRITPFMTREYYKELIRGEIESVKKGERGFIRIKLNSLIDREMIDALYEAADAGVEIQLIIRGICGLLPRENITVKSIVGRFLEHSRIYYFYHGGEEKVFIASMDWMERSFDRRVESLVPVLDKDIKKIVMAIFERCYTDTAKSYYLMEDGKYVKMIQEGDLFNVQDYFLEVPTLEITDEEIE